MFAKIIRHSAILAVALVMVGCSANKPPPSRVSEEFLSRSNASAPARTTAAADVATPAAASVAATAPAATAVSGAVVLRQPPKSGGGIIPSAWRQPNGSASDRSVWDNFMFETPHSLTEVRWRGAYDPARQGTGGPVINFTVDIYSSIPTGSEPNLALAPLVHYVVGDNAGETRGEVVAGVQTYEYRYKLPESFEAATLTPYWVQIVAFQAGAPDWGLLVGSLGDGRHFRLSGAPGEGYYHQLVPEDVTLEWVASGTNAATPVPDAAQSLEEIEAQMANLPPAEEIPVGPDGVQEVTLVVSRSGYTPVHLAVRAGVPVRFTFRQLGYVPGGNELNVRWGPQEGTYVMLSSIADKKVLEFTPQLPGEYRYSCPHDWYWGVMTVRE
jgi:hypothetical protein